MRLVYITSFFHLTEEEKGNHENTDLAEELTKMQRSCKMPSAK